MTKAIIGSMCWIFDHDRVLMLRRNKYPHQGMLAAPGGKLEDGESPEECVIREMREETGLIIDQPVLKGIITMSDIDTGISWLLFLYQALTFSGSLADRRDDEGPLCWECFDHYADLPMAQSDRLFLEWTIHRPGVFQAKIEYQASQGIFNYQVI